MADVVESTNVGKATVGWENKSCLSAYILRISASPSSSRRSNINTSGRQFYKRIHNEKNQFKPKQQGYTQTRGEQGCEPSIRPCSPRVSHSSVVRVSNWYLKGHGFDSHWGLRKFFF